MKGETKLTENQELALPGSVFKDSFGRDYLTVSQAVCVYLYLLQILFTSIDILIRSFGNDFGNDIDTIT